MRELLGLLYNTKYFATGDDVRNIETCLEMKKCNFFKDNDLLSAVNLSCSFRCYFSFILGLGRIEPIAIHLTIAATMLPLKSNNQFYVKIPIYFVGLDNKSFTFLLFSLGQKLFVRLPSASYSTEQEGACQYNIKQTYRIYSINRPTSPNKHPPCMQEKLMSTQPRISVPPPPPHPPKKKIAEAHKMSKGIVDYCFFIGLQSLNSLSDSCELQQQCHV